MYVFLRINVPFQIVEIYGVYEMKSCVHVITQLLPIYTLCIECVHRLLQQLFLHHRATPQSWCWRRLCGARFSIIHIVIYRRIFILVKWLQTSRAELLTLTYSDIVS